MQNFSVEEIKELWEKMIAQKIQNDIMNKYKVPGTEFDSDTVISESIEEIKKWINDFTEDEIKKLALIALDRLMYSRHITKVEDDSINNSNIRYIVNAQQQGIEEQSER